MITKYKIFYETDGEIIECEVDEKELQDFLDGLEPKNMSVFTAKKIKNIIEKQQKEIEKYKRYFKLAISDLQSEGYMQMPYENIEKYYSKREDTV